GLARIPRSSPSSAPSCWRRCRIRRPIVWSARPYMIPKGYLFILGQRRWHLFALAVLIFLGGPVGVVIEHGRMLGLLPGLPGCRQVLVMLERDCPLHIAVLARVGGLLLGVIGCRKGRQAETGDQYSSEPFRLHGEVLPGVHRV